MDGRIDDVDLSRYYSIVPTLSVFSKDRVHGEEGETCFSIAPPGTCETVLFSRGSRLPATTFSAVSRSRRRALSANAAVRLSLWLASRASSKNRLIRSKGVDPRLTVDTGERECPQTGLDLEYFFLLLSSFRRQ